MAIFDSPPVTPSDEILDFLLSQPTPEEVIALRASQTSQERLRYLLDTNRESVLNDAERVELDQAIQMDNWVARLKARARLKLSQQ